MLRMLVGAGVEIGRSKLLAQAAQTPEQKREELDPPPSSAATASTDPLLQVEPPRRPLVTVDLLR